MQKCEMKSFIELFDTRFKITLRIHFFLQNTKKMNSYSILTEIA